MEVGDVRLVVVVFVRGATLLVVHQAVRGRTGTGRVGWHRLLLVLLLCFGLGGQVLGWSPLISASPFPRVLPRRVAFPVRGNIVVFPVRRRDPVVQRRPVVGGHLCRGRVTHSIRVSGRRIKGCDAVVVHTSISTTSGLLSSVVVGNVKT